MAINNLAAATEHAALEYLLQSHELEGLISENELQRLVDTICEAALLDQPAIYEALVRHAETETNVAQLEAEMALFEKAFGDELDFDAPDGDDPFVLAGLGVADDIAFDAYREASR